MQGVRQRAQPSRVYLRGDALMRRFFEVFLFEDVPAADRRTDDLYLDEVRRCDIYVGLFGSDYGTENSGGLSPTEREFDLATAERKCRLIYVRGTDDDDRHPKMRALIGRAEAGLIRKGSTPPRNWSPGCMRRSSSTVEKQLIRSGPFGGRVPGRRPAIWTLNGWHGSSARPERPAGSPRSRASSAELWST